MQAGRITLGVIVALLGCAIAVTWIARAGPFEMGASAESAEPAAGAVAAEPAAPEPEAPAASSPAEPLPPTSERINWRISRAVGKPFAGRLIRGVRLPSAGREFFTWDPVRKRTPNRGWRRWGANGTMRSLLWVLERFREAHPRAPRIGVGDLSRPRGGDFGPRFGSLGHASHQNGLDVDVYYPRRDRREWRAKHPSQVDRRLSQKLVDLFVRAGAEYVFVGPRTGLRGPRGIVQPLANHDDHLHARFPKGRGAPGPLATRAGSPNP